MAIVALVKTPRLLTTFVFLLGFYINLPIGGAVAVFLVFSRIPDQTQKPDPMSVLKQLHRKLDLVGFALFAPAPIQLLLALQYGGHQFAWKSATVIGLFCGSAGTLALWAVWNYRKGDEALIPWSMAKKQAVWSSSLTQLFLFSTMIIISYFLPIYFQAAKGASPVMSGVYTLAGILSQLFAAVISGILGRYAHAMFSDCQHTDSQCSWEARFRNPLGVRCGRYFSCRQWSFVPFCA